MSASATPPPGVPADQRREVARLLQEAGSALAMDRPASAEPLLERALAIEPGNGEAHRLIGIASLMVGKYAKAVDHLRSALAGSPDDAAINMTLGSALVETGDTQGGLAHLQRACEIASTDAVAWCNYGVALQFAGERVLARDMLARAVALEPGYIKARDKLADVLQDLGDIPAAVTTLRETLRRQPGAVHAWQTLGYLKTQRMTAADVAQLRSLLRDQSLNDTVRVALGFTLAKALEDQADFAGAYRAVCEANALKHRQSPWGRSAERERVAAIARAFAAPVAGAPDATLGREVIFIVSLPRAGSTLTEQILASHAQVQGGDETNALPEILHAESKRRGEMFPGWVRSATRADWQRMGEEYLARCQPWRNERPRCTDKTLDNWALVGAALAMLPGARVVNSRRDPLETCFACFRQLFQVGCDFTYDLDDMVDYYAGYDRLSALWRRTFPRRWFDHQYESLLRDSEGQIRRLLDFCQLPFDAACLSFHRTARTVRTISSSQVREPLQHNTARAPRYGALLDPLRTKLAAAGIVTSGI